MARGSWVVVALALLSASSDVVASEREARLARVLEAFPPDETTTYAVSEELSLEMNVFLPDAGRFPGARAAAVFYFGGGWRQGTPIQFFPFCSSLAERGMACFAPDYRVLSRQGTDAPTALDDARAAIVWTRSHAKEYRVDPGRLYAGGGSAGGHLAAASGVIPSAGGELPGLAGLLLFNPAVDLNPGGRPAERLKALFRGNPFAYSPIEFVRSGLPPTWIVHGEADTTVPIDTVRRFCELMKAAGNDCRLRSFPGEPHGFFNYGGDSYRDVLADLLEHLGLSAAGGDPGH